MLNLGHWRPTRGLVYLTVRFNTSTKQYLLYVVSIEILPVWKLFARQISFVFINKVLCLETIGLSYFQYSTSTCLYDTNAFSLELSKYISLQHIVITHLKQTNVPKLTRKVLKSFKFVNFIVYIVLYFYVSSNYIFSWSSVS